MGCQKADAGTIMARGHGMSRDKLEAHHRRSCVQFAAEIARAHEMATKEEDDVPISTSITCRRSEARESLKTWRRRRTYVNIYYLSSWRKNMRAQDTHITCSDDPPRDFFFRFPATHRPESKSRFRVDPVSSEIYANNGPHLQHRDKIPHFDATNRLATYIRYSRDQRRIRISVSGVFRKSAK